MAQIIDGKKISTWDEIRPSLQGIKKKALR